MAISIGIETALQDDVRELVRQLNAYLNPLSPKEFQFQMTVEQMAGPETTLFVARDDAGRAVGMGALKEHTPTMGEVKRMYTLPNVRGQRVGSALLMRIEDLARRKGITHLLLETGGARVAGFEPAHRLYERGGFTKRGAFLDYPETDWSTFYEKHLPAQEAAE
jgi:putative acetyltransferase